MLCLINYPASPMKASIYSCHILVPLKKMFFFSIAYLKEQCYFHRFSRYINYYLTFKPTITTKFYYRNFMLDKDGSEDFIEDIMEELVDSTMDKIYDIYIDKQLLPFTVTMAKDAILQIIDVSLLSYPSMYQTRNREYLLYTQSLFNWVM